MLEKLFNKVAILEVLLKRDFNTGVFLQNLRNIKDTIFYRTGPVVASDV